jgi:hypothetical protein
MTEAQWLACEDPNEMLVFVRQASDWKLRLYFCESAWHVRHLLTDNRSWQAVAVAERYADGTALLTELDSAHTGLSQFLCSSRHTIFKSPRKMGLIARKLTA